jgi:hypothetical protein
MSWRFRPQLAVEPLQSAVAPNGLFRHISGTTHGCAIEAASHSHSFSLPSRWLCYCCSEV